MISSLSSGVTARTSDPPRTPSPGRRARPRRPAAACGSILASASSTRSVPAAGPRGHPHRTHAARRRCTATRSPRRRWCSARAPAARTASSRGCWRPADALADRRRSPSASTSSDAPRCPGRRTWSTTCSCRCAARPASAPGAAGRRPGTGGCRRTRRRRRGGGRGPARPGRSGAARGAAAVEDRRLRQHRDGRWRQPRRAPAGSAPQALRQPTPATGPSRRAPQRSGLTDSVELPRSRVAGRRWRRSAQPALSVLRLAATGRGPADGHACSTPRRGSTSTRQRVAVALAQRPARASADACTVRRRSRAAAASDQTMTATSGPRAPAGSGVR